MKKVMNGALRYHHLSFSKTRFRVCRRENRGMILCDDWDLETDSNLSLLKTLSDG